MKLMWGYEQNEGPAILSHLVKNTSRDVSDLTISLYRHFVSYVSLPSPQLRLETNNAPQIRPRILQVREESLSSHRLPPSLRISSLRPRQAIQEAFCRTDLRGDSVLRAVRDARVEFGRLHFVSPS
jgi:hypothetical protein